MEHLFIPAAMLRVEMGYLSGAFARQPDLGDYAAVVVAHTMPECQIFDAISRYAIMTPRTLVVNIESENGQRTTNAHLWRVPLGFSKIGSEAAYSSGTDGDVFEIFEERLELDG